MSSYSLLVADPSVVLAAAKRKGAVDIEIDSEHTRFDIRPGIQNSWKSNGTPSVIRGGVISI